MNHNAQYGKLHAKKKQPLPCPDYPEKCECAKGCTVIDVRLCPYAKKKNKCCETDGIKYE